MLKCCRRAADHCHQRVYVSGWRLVGNGNCHNCCNWSNSFCLLGTSGSLQVLQVGEDCKRRWVYQAFSSGDHKVMSRFQTEKGRGHMYHWSLDNGVGFYINMSFRAFCFIREFDIIVLVPILYWSRISLMLIVLVSPRGGKPCAQASGMFLHSYSDWSPI